MPDRRCCCVGCQIGFDDFKRANATTIGAKWMEPIDGTWHVVSEEAVEQTGTGRVLFAKEHPVPDTSMVAYLDAVDPQVGDVYELLVNSIEAGTSFHLAKFTIKDTGTVTIGLYKNSVLLEEEDTVGWTGTRFRMQAIISRTQFCATITNAVFSLTWYGMPDLIASGYYAGMGVDGRIGIAVDDWEFYEHLETHAGCPFCICHCEDYPISPSLVAVIVDATGRMIDFGGCTISLWWDRVLLNWQQDPAARCNCISGPADLGLILTCDSVNFTLAGITLEISKTCHDSVLGSGHKFHPIIPPSTCDPFFLRFGPVFIAAGDLACCYDVMSLDSGEYYIEITEPP